MATVQVTLYKEDFKGTGDGYHLDVWEGIRTRMEDAGMIPQGTDPDGVDVEIMRALPEN